MRETVGRLAKVANIGRLPRIRREQCRRPARCGPIQSRDFPHWDYRELADRGCRSGAMEADAPDRRHLPLLVRRHVDPSKILLQEVIAQDLAERGGHGRSTLAHAYDRDPASEGEVEGASHDPEPRPLVAHGAADQDITLTASTPASQIDRACSASVIAFMSLSFWPRGPTVQYELASTAAANLARYAAVA